MRVVLMMEHDFPCDGRRVPHIIIGDACSREIPCVTRVEGRYASVISGIGQYYRSARRSITGVNGDGRWCGIHRWITMIRHRHTGDFIGG